MNQLKVNDFYSTQPRYFHRLCTSTCLLLVFFATSPALGSQNNPQDNHHEICIQSFNAYGPAYSTALEERTRALGDYLELSPCDIVQLQEVWSESHHEWAIGALQKSLPYLSAARFDHFQNPAVGNSGLSIFTSQVLTHQSFERFMVNNDGMIDTFREFVGVIKGIGSSVVSLRDDESIKIQMFNVHLHPSSKRVRIAQVTQLLEKLASFQDLPDPVIITGDFNFQPQSEEYALLRDVGGFTDTFVAANGNYQASTCTYCSSNPHHWPGNSGVIDYIWSRQGQITKLESLRSIVNLQGIGGVVPSDHYGVRTHFSISRNFAGLNNNYPERKKHPKEARLALERALGILSSDDNPSQENNWVKTARQKLSTLLQSSP